MEDIFFLSPFSGNNPFCCSIYSDHHDGQTRLHHPAAARM